MNTKSLEFSFPSKLEESKAAISNILRFLKDVDPKLAEDKLLDLKLIFHELICNAILHGNKKDYGKKVHVGVTFEHDKICGFVRDEGVGFDYTNLKLEKFEDFCEWHRECGRGIKIANELSDFLELTDEGRLINFYKLVDHA